MRAAIDGGHAHDAVLVHLKTQVRTVEVLFYHLRRMQVIAYPLVLGVFLEGIVAFNGVYGFLLFLQHAVEVGKRLFLFFQFHLLHESDALASGFKCFRVEYLDAVNLHFRFAVIAAFKSCAGGLEPFTGFFLHIAAREERATEARKEGCFLHNFHS